MIPVLVIARAIAAPPVLKLFEEASPVRSPQQSWGIRPQRGRITSNRVRRKKHWVLVTDIERFFNNVDYSVLDKILRGSPFRLSRDLRLLISSFLKVPLKEGEKLVKRNKGISPSLYFYRLLSNVYLHPVDSFCRNLFYNRYVDDLIVFCSSKKEAISAYIKIKDFLKENLKLSLNEAKTRITHRYQEGFCFLGFLVKGDYLQPTEEVIKDFRHRIKMLTETRQKKGPRKVIRALNKRIHNFGHMYKMGSVRGLYEELDAFIRMRVRSYLKSRRVPVLENPGSAFVKPEEFPTNLAYSNKRLRMLGLASLLVISEKGSNSLWKLSALN